MFLRPYTQSRIDISRFKKINNKSKEGGFGLVYIVENQDTKKKYAAKIIKYPNNEEYLDREIGILMSANHPTIVKFIGFSDKDIHDENNITIILELATNGSLSDILEQIQNSNTPSNYTNTTRQIILIGVARGMKYLHDRNILHRDLKPDNVLLNDKFHPLITDFGASKYFKVGHSKSQSREIGTLPYEAPEIIENKPCGRKADVYSFGILMYEVVTDLVPYPDLMNNKIGRFDFQSKIVNESYRPKFKNPIKSSIQELIERCWSANPNDRPTFSELFKMLSENKDVYFLDGVDQNQVNDYIESITKIDEPIEELNQKIESIEKQTFELKSSNDQIANENDQLKSEIKELNTNVERLNNDINQLFVENVKLINSNDQLITENKQLKDDINQLSLNNKIIKDENELLINQNINNFVESNVLYLSPNQKVIQELGSSSFGHIFSVEDTITKQKFVSKIGHKTFLIDDEQVSSYINSLSKIQNSAVLSYTDIKQRKIMNRNRFIISSKLMRMGSLHQLIFKYQNANFKHSNLNTIKYINLLGIALGMQYLHSQKIIHGNLTLENILYDQDLSPHISDFGLFKLIDKNELNLNSIVFTSPEIFEGKVKEQNFQTDVYSYSMVAYSIITGEYPDVEGSSSIMKIQNIIKGKRPNLTMIKNKLIKTFIQKCWSSNPRDRLSFDQIVEMISDHSFYSLFNADISQLLEYLTNFQNKSPSVQKLYFSLKYLSSEIDVFKIVCVGNAMTGKTALVQTFSKRSKVVVTYPTRGVNYTCAVKRNGNIKYGIWDTSGNKSYVQKLLPGYLNDTHAIILFTDVSQNEEYKDLQKFIDIISDKWKLKDERPLLYLATTKIDIGWNNKVEDIQSFADEFNLKLFTTSIDDLDSIDLMFNSIIDDLVEKFKITIQ